MNDTYLELPAEVDDKPVRWRKLPIGSIRQDGDYAKHSDAYRLVAAVGTPVMSGEVSIYRWYPAKPE